jgi:hypothetical protein
MSRTVGLVLLMAVVLPAALATGPPTSIYCNGLCGANARHLYNNTVVGTDRVIFTRGIPDSNVYQTFASGNAANPNSACEHPVTVSVPASPSLQSSHVTSPLGPVGVLVTGGFIYNHLDGPESDTADLAIPNRETSLDTCNGHPDVDCRYHYHKNPEACFTGYNDCSLIGYLRDGFPIYSYCTINSVTLTSCWKLNSGAAGTDSSHFTFDSAAYGSTCQLDQSNGYCFPTSTGKGIATTDPANGNAACNYGYVMTPNYPFVMPKYHGSVLKEFSYFEDTGNSLSSCNSLVPGWIVLLATLVAIVAMA